jgi:cytochrome c oxidase assembly protein subunit 15
MTPVPVVPLPSSIATPPLTDLDRHAAARLSKWFLALAIATWVQIGFGALVRAKKAGLACPDWPLCYGAVVPDLKLDGVIYEWGHRAFASLISLLFVFCFVLGWRQPVLKARIGRWLVGAAGLLLAQIVMGGLTVLIVHKGDGDPRPAAWTVSTHLILGNLLAALAILASQDLRHLTRQTISGSEPVPGLTRGVLGLWTTSLVTQFVLGGAIAGNIAGLVCTEFPTCNGGVWFPTFEGFVGLQVFHRLNAYLLLTLALTFAFRVRAHTGLAAMGKGLAGLVLLQACVGAVNIFAVLHTHVTTLHSVLAALLFSATAVLWHRVLQVRSVA